MHTHSSVSIVFIFVIAGDQDLSELKNTTKQITDTSFIKKYSYVHRVSDLSSKIQTDQKSGMKIYIKLLKLNTIIPRQRAENVKAAVDSKWQVLDMSVWKECKQ